MLSKLFQESKPCEDALDFSTTMPIGDDNVKMILLLSCTAGGKTEVSLDLAERLDAEILSVDSMQVYRRMDIGTAKPAPFERSRVPHHMIDVAEPSESFSVARFVDEADRAITDILSRRRRVLALAGTPLYLMGLMYGMFEGPSADEAFRAALRDRADREGTATLHAGLSEVDPEAARRIHPNDYKRIERALEVWHVTGRRLSEQQQQWSATSLRYPAVVVGIRREREDTARRVNARVKAMVQAGLVDEVRSLLAAPGGLSQQARQALGYAQIIAHLRGESSLDEAVEQTKIQTRQFAKHQRTWFRKFPMTRWLDAAPQEPTPSISARLVTLIGESSRYRTTG
jgi:tRNA dimethylallyltransferase